MKRVATTGSVWLFDEAGRYLRMPCTETGREPCEWGNTPGPLLDNEWHQHLGVMLAGGSEQRLRIQVSGRPLDQQGLITGRIVGGLEDARAVEAAYPWQTVL